MKPLGRYLFLISSLQGSNGKTFETINEEWLKSRRNTEDENMPILKRSFHNHIAAIREQFGIHIECGPGYRYYIADPDKDVLPIVERLSMLNMMSETVYNSKLNRNIYLDDLYDLFRENNVMMIMNAIKTKHKIKLENYLWPHKPENIYRVLSIAPYQLHNICNKWYVIGLTDEFGLMRIPLSYYYGEVRITDESYKYPVNYLPEKYSEMIYGMTNEKIHMTIQIQDISPKRLYLNKYPIMPFQQEIDYGYRDKEGNRSIPIADNYFVRVNFDLPQTPFALYVLKRRLEKYSYTILSDTDSFALYTDEQYEDAVNNPVVL